MNAPNNKMPYVAATAIIVGMVLVYVLVRNLLPSPVAFQDSPLNENTQLLKEVDNSPNYAMRIRPQSGRAESLIGYVGLIVVRDTSPEATVSFDASHRPQRQELEVAPADEKLYEGKVTSALNTGGEFTSFATALNINEAADVNISNVLFVGYRDNSRIPWNELKAIVTEPNKEYFFVDSAVLTITTYRKFQKLTNANSIEGTAFKANGEIYASVEGFNTERVLSLRMFDLRLLKPSQGTTTDSAITTLLSKEQLSDKDSELLLRALHQESLEDARKLRVRQEDFADVKPDLSIKSMHFDALIGSIPVLKQTKANGCWATAAAMLYGWRSGDVVSVERFLDKVAPSFSDTYNRDRGLSVDEARHFVEAVGLQFEYGQCYLPVAVQEMLEAHGPLWFTVGSPEGYNTHANIVTGIGVDAHGTHYIRYIDPQDGRMHEEAYNAFMGRYESPAFLYNRFFMKQMVDGQIVPMHVVHY